jgi:hypothetical protein
MKIKILILAAFGLLALHATSAFAQQTIAVDEQGNYILNGVQQPNGILGIEPVSGMQCLVFPLFFLPNPGDIEVIDSDGTTGDIIRFAPNSAKLYFFSLLDTNTGPDGIADVPVLPPPIAALNRIILPENGPEGNNSIFWPAPPGGIGADGANPVQYTFQSDGLVPEPSTFILLGLGSAGVGIVAYKRRKGAA